MKKIAGTLALSLLSTLSFAHERANPPLDKVVFQISAKQWVTTQTVLLKINVNATLSNADLVKARADIMDKLTKIAAGEWHLTQFDRSQDSSGLEKLFVEAQARVPQASLTDIYQNAKNVSKPGTTYTINGVEFKPSLQEIQKVRAELRGQLYEQVNAELNILNKIYTGQQYTVNRIYILDGDNMPQPQAYKAREVVATAAPAPTLAVSNEMIMSALVEAGSNRITNNGSASSAAPNP